MAGEGNGGVAAGELFADTTKRWLLIAGAGLSASSGVPQPHRRTRWSPSIGDVVTHELFRTQNRQVFDAVEHSRDAPPLGYVGDTLEQQDAWFANYLEGHKPYTPLIRCADLIKAGVFRAVATNAPDRLLNAALDSVGVTYKQVSLEDPHQESGGPLPLLREWDARVFKDTEDRRTRESSFVRGQLGELLQHVDGVLVVGHSATRSDLLDSVVRAAEAHDGLEVVWVDDAGDDSDDPGAGDSAVAWLDQHHESFVHVRTDNLGVFLDDVASQRKVAKTPVGQPEEAEPLLERALNKSFDVRPALVFVPGVALLGGLVDKLPRISVKMIISIFALLLVIVAYINWDIWTEYRDQINPVKAHLGKAKKLLKQADSYEGAIRAEAELNDAARKAARVVLPYDSVFSISLVHRDIGRDYEDTKLAIKTIRDLQITPMLYRNRFRSEVESNPSRMSLANHPPLLVVPGLGKQAKDPRGVTLMGKELASIRLPKPLANYVGKPRLALFSSSAPLLRETMQDMMLRDLRAGRLAIEVDLSRPANQTLEDQIYQSVKRVAGYVGERAALFSPDGITNLLDQGKGSFYFFHIEASGTARSVDRIRELLVRFPKNRAVLAAYSEKARMYLAQSAPELELVTLANFERGAAMTYLHKHTSSEFVRRLMQNHYLRSNVGDPLVLSLLVDYYKFSGAVPRSLALVYDRLLQGMLSLGKYTYASKFPALRALAWEMSTTRNNLTRERATTLIAHTLFRKGNRDGAAAVLDELVGNGVLRYRDDTFVDFMDANLYQLSLAKHLRRVSSEQRARLLTADRGQLPAFYAGIYPDVDRLIAELTGDFYAVDKALAAKQLRLARVNPFTPRLVTASVLANNGAPTASVVGRLERTLFGLVEHQVPEVVNGAFAAIRALSSAGARRWVLVGLAESRAYDQKLLQFTASAPESTYVDAIQRWLRRVGGDQDPRQNSRYTRKNIRTSPTGPWRTQRGPLTSKTAWAIRHGLHTLAQLDSRRASQVIAEFVSQAKGAQRFGTKLWNNFRRNAVGYLLEAHRHETVRGFYKEILDDPGAWTQVIPALYRLNDKATVQLLVDIIAKPEPFTRQTPKHKSRAAKTLALMDKALVVPALEAYMAKAPTDPTTDYRPYAAASLAYRGDPGDFAPVAKLVSHARANPIKSLKAHRFASDYAGVLSHAVAAFGTKAAFKLFSELYADASWRKRASGLDGQWRYLRSVGGPDAALERLLCHSSGRGSRTLMDQLGFMRNEQARGYLLRVIRMVEGDADPGFLARVCKDHAAAKARVDGWRKRGLHSLVRALAADPRAKDLARYARWAMHGDREVRRAAYYALTGYQVPAAGKAIADSLVAHELESEDKRTLVGTGVYLLGQQGNPANARELLSWLDRDDAPKTSIVIALGKCGGMASLLRLLGSQPVTTYRGNLARAIYLISDRVRGRRLTTTPQVKADALLGAVLSRLAAAPAPARARP